jgi:plasmid stabilization system protein ParE
LAWSIEVSAYAKDDLRAIYRHLVRTHHETFGYDLATADQRATHRIGVIRQCFDRIAKTVHVGTEIPSRAGAFRYVSFDKTVFWFRLDAEKQCVVIEGIFHGGQDHLGRMMSRLTDEGGG